MEANAFAAMDPDVLKQVPGWRQSVSFPKGSWIMHEGEPSDGAHVIDAGEVRMEARAVGRAGAQTVLSGTGGTAGRVQPAGRAAALGPCMTA